MCGNKSLIDRFLLKLSANLRMENVRLDTVIVNRRLSSRFVDGQQFAPDLGYVPLPEQVVQLNKETLRRLTINVLH